MAKYRGTSDDDYLTGTDGADVMIGGAGYDTLRGDGGNDYLVGGADADFLWGGDGKDRLRGGDDGDVLRGEAGNDIILGEAGDDFAYGGAGNDQLIGGDGNDVLIGEDGADILTGGVGDDFFRGGAGVDRVDGGDGFDTVSYLDAGATQGAVVDLRTGKVANDGFGNVETIVGIEGVTGTVNSDTIYGTDGNNRFNVGAGDTVSGFAGDDGFLVSSIENATLDGGTGSDAINLAGGIVSFDATGKQVNTYAEQKIVLSLDAQIVLNDGFGFSHSIAGFEHATIGSSGRLYGDSGDNHLIGSSGDDSIVGKAGYDWISGGLGADTMTGGPGKDVFAFGTYGEYFGVGFDYGDVITDFAKGDKLDIFPDFIPLSFIGSREFDDNRDAYAIRYEIQDGNTRVDVRSWNPAGHIEFSIKLLGVHELTAADFLDLRAPAAEPIHAPLLATTHLADLASLV